MFTFYIKSSKSKLKKNSFIAMDIIHVSILKIHKPRSFCDNIYKLKMNETNQNNMTLCWKDFLNSDKHITMCSTKLNGRRIM